MQGRTPQKQRSTWKEEGIVKGKNAGRKSVCKEEHHRSREALGRLECMCVCVVGGGGGGGRLKEWGNQNSNTCREETVTPPLKYLAIRLRENEIVKELG